MKLENHINKFVIQGFKNVSNELISNEIHHHTLKDFNQNFITKPQEGFKFETTANSLKSSQAFAYNIFSGIKAPTLTFEFEMPLFTSPVQIDVMYENPETNTINLFEVKLFELKKTIADLSFIKQFFKTNNYKDKEIAVQFIRFLYIVLVEFTNEPIYSMGVKLLCSHTLGIINLLQDEKYKNKKFKLHSICFDHTFNHTFTTKIEKYKNTTTVFKNHLDDFLKAQNLNHRIEYTGFIGANEFINSNQDLIGLKNIEYVKKRYYF